MEKYVWSLENKVMNLKYFSELKSNFSQSHRLIPILCKIKVSIKVLNLRNCEKKPWPKHVTDCIYHIYLI